MSKTITLIYGIFCYLFFFAVFSYTILFIGNIWVTPGLDTIASSNFIQALAIDIALVVAFGLQHSIMARPAFKKQWTKIVPPAAERSTYVLASAVFLGLIVYFWQPLGGVLWQIENPIAVAVIYTLFALGWGLVFLSTFLINHFDLFGLRQVWLNFRDQPYTTLKFETPWLYRYMRHPLYTGFMLALWAAPTMTAAHFIFALLLTIYILIGSRLEEKDLEHALPEYKRYKDEVPMFFPNLTRNSQPSEGGESYR